MSLLDTVEPDAKMKPNGTCASIQRLKDNCTRENQIANGWIDTNICFLYSRPKMEAHIESLLSQCRKEARKEALLEAADKCAYHRDVAKLDKLHSAADRLSQLGFELRRMAEGEKE